MEGRPLCRPKIGDETALVPPTFPRLTPGLSSLNFNLLCSVQDNEEMRLLEGSMRGGALVDGAVFRHLVILNQTKAPIDQGLFVFVS
jgi:hypothetical protein